MKLSLKYFRRAAKASLFAMLINLPFSTQALDLPIKAINGVQYYFREIMPKETIYGICRELGISKDEIVRHNPAVADGLKAGMVLYFPVSEYEPSSNNDDASSQSAPAQNAIIETADAHLVEKGETIYGISRHYGISTEDLIAANPQIKSGLKTGMLLNIPSSNTSSTSAVVETIPEPVRNTTPSSHAEITEDNATEPDAEITPELTASDFNNPADDDQAESQEEEEDAPVKISVILPFMLTESQPDKQTQLYTEFFKGMLLAADSLKNNRAEIVLNAYDSANSIDTVKWIISQPDFAGTDIIIGPDNDQQLAIRLEYADTTGAII